MKISEICDINANTVNRKKDRIIQYLDTANLTDGVIDKLQTMQLFDAPSRAQRVIRKNTILYSVVRPALKHYGIIKENAFDIIASTGFATLDIKEKVGVDPDYLYYALTRSSITERLQSIAENSTSSYPSITPADIGNIEITFPHIDEQKRIAKLLSTLDKKISVNQAINHNLEEQIQQLFRYWFLQFEFPDEDGLPYKANGGSFVWNEALKKEIPSIFTPEKLSSFIRKHNTGDWGDELPSDDSIKVGCIRGADIIRLNNIPQRYIKGNNRNKLLNEWDLVIEVSGGSPTQATGRSALITPGVIKRNGGTITCSNFCHAFSFEDINKAPYFSFVWKTFYESGAMFNFEGKTSGIKNFMTDSFLTNMWFDIPDKLAKVFFDKVYPTINEIDRRISENDALQIQRNYLLPLLISGKVSVSSLNYDLSDD